MKFLIISADYPLYRHWLYQRHPGLENRPYQEQSAVRRKSPFGIGEYYAQNLRDQGHQAWNLYVGNEYMQKAWAVEHDLYVEQNASSQALLENLLGVWRRVSHTPAYYLKSILRPLYRALERSQAWKYPILAEQISYYRPDVLINLVMDFVSNDFLEAYKPKLEYLVGQIAWLSTDQNHNYRAYDLVLSSLPKTIAWFQSQGIPARKLRLGFEPQILSQIDRQGKPILLSFVGSLFSMHQERIELLEKISRRFDLGIWGPEADFSANPQIRRAYRGTAWGVEMFNILCQSQITINHHIDIGGNYANNMRLYEATGVGTMLLTDWKENLDELFEIGAEVVAYHDVEECIDLLDYYLEHHEERDKIAHAGQQRTLAEHTYKHRVEEILAIINEMEA